MGHQTEHIASWIRDPCNVGNGAIGIVVVFQCDAVFILKRF